MRYLTIVSTSLLVTCSIMSFCVDANSANINISGTLIEPPPCTVNNGVDIDVGFGKNVGVDRVDGENYKQKIPYSYTCEPNPERLDLGLEIYTTNVSSFDNSAVATNIPDFAIKILMDGKPLVLNKRVTIDPGSHPILEAVPIKLSGATLPDGEFTATATLLVSYE